VNRSRQKPRGRDSEEDNDNDDDDNIGADVADALTKFWQQRLKLWKANGDATQSRAAEKVPRRSPYRDLPFKFYCTSLSLQNYLHCLG